MNKLLTIILLVSLGLGANAQGGKIVFKSYVDSTDLLRVRFTDTSSMLSAYRTALNTLAASGGITKVNYTDTSAMLAAYRNALNTLATGGTKVSYTDTASMLSAYQTSLNTKALGSTVTANQLLNTKYSDTSSMLSAYRTSLNTKALGTTVTANQLLNIKYTDSAAMLSAYRTALLARMLYTDTAAMLANYRTTLTFRNATATSAYGLVGYANTNGVTLKSIKGDGLINWSSQDSSVTGTLDSATLFSSYRTALNARQPALVSGTNIKSINGFSLLGSGDLTISGGAGGDMSYADTSAMLSAYRTSLNTKALGSTVTANQLLNVKYTDSASILAAYQTALNARASGTTVTANQALNVKYTDTTSMLAAYQTAINTNTGTLNTKLADDPQVLGWQAMGSSLKATAMAVYNIAEANVGIAQSNQQMRIEAVYLPKAATLTGVKVFMKVAGVYTGANYNGVGLYSVSGGTLTLVASSTNNANVWTAATNTLLSVPFSSTYAASAGLYYVATLYCQSAQTTAPSFAGNNNSMNGSIQSTMDFTNSNQTSAVITTQTTLPSTQALSGLSTNLTPHWMGLY